MNPPARFSARFVIAFTGAQGVGKSTVVSALESQLIKLGVGPVTVHQKLGQTAAAEKVPLGERANNLTIMEFAKFHVRRERQLGPGVHLLDRCFVDLLAYTRSVCGAQKSLVELIEELTLASLSRLDVVVRVPMIPTLAQNQSPNESSQFRSQIDQAITGSLPHLGVDFLELTETTVAERVSEITRFLRAKSLLWCTAGSSSPPHPV